MEIYVEFKFTALFCFCLTEVIPAVALVMLAFLLLASGLFFEFEISGGRYVTTDSLLLLLNRCKFKFKLRK
jgi:hypothetical protein